MNYSRYIEHDCFFIEGELWKVEERRGGGWMRIWRRVGMFKKVYKTVRITEGF